MASNIQWNRATAPNASWPEFGETIANLSSGAERHLGNIDNRDGLYTHLAVSLKIQASSSLTIGSGSFTLYMLGQGVVNGSPGLGSATPIYLGTFTPQTTSTSKYMFIDNILISPVVYALYARNELGVAVGSSSDGSNNRCGYLLYNKQIVTS